MKFNINQIFKLTIIFIFLSFVCLTKLRVDPEDSLNLEDQTSSEISLNGPSNNKFKGHVIFENEGRGIVIKSTNGEQNDKLLKLVSDKLNPDTYIVDYRLMRNCEFSVYFSGENKKNIKLVFSAKSLENKNKNEKFEIKLEIMNFSKFFPKIEKTEMAIQNKIKTQCEKRKERINSFKSDLITQFSDYKENLDKNKFIRSKIKSSKKRADGFNSSIKDITSQITQINSLQKSYENQKKNLELLMNGSNKLLRKERRDFNSTIYINIEINNNLKENSIQLKKLSERENQLKKNYESFILEQKGIEGEMIKMNEKLSETDKQISSLSRNKLLDEYEIQYSKSKQKEINVHIFEIRNQIMKLNI